MQWDGDLKPRLRPVEAFRIPGEDGAVIGLRDRSGLSDVVLSLSLPALQILAMMDGESTCEDIRRGFLAQFGQPLSAQTLSSMLAHLEAAHLLEGEEFEAYYQACLERYREQGVRHMPHAAGLGIDSTGGVFADMLEEAGATNPPAAVRGIIAPHLDYARGKPCYRAAYGALRGRASPDRVVILGTNHFGRSTSVVATGNDFETPLGKTAVDREFIERLEARCGDLRAFELDHAREHSVELQVAWLQFLFGAEAFSIVPVLCPDPCGPTGTAPRDGKGADLGEFAAALRASIEEDAGDTLVVAGADLSHVGGAFGDDHELEDGHLERVRQRDRRALTALVESSADAFVQVVAEQDNPTRVCSAGCMFVLARALEGASPNLAGYHQAVDRPSQACVTCAAVVYT